MRKINLFLLIIATGLSHAFSQKINKTAAQPNIIYILTDDLGIGDVSFYNPNGKIRTPNIDKLGQEGMTFNDVHSSSSVCTPSRYSIVTGRYAWRSRLKDGVLYGFDEPLTDSNRTTVADLLKQGGYTTACIGKWHLGLNWAITKPGKQPVVDYSKPIEGGPNSLGFDYFYGIAASLDMPPYIFIENKNTIGIPTTTKSFGRNGAAAEDFEAVNCLPDLTTKAVAYIKDKSAERKPFFLYFSMPSPHTPIVPSEKFKGKSGINPYADYVMETDWAVGEILTALEKEGIAENTMVVFTSDNGVAPSASKRMEALGHYPSMQFRGHKSDIWEGGHRIPFLVRWPARVKAASTCDKTVCLSDFMATVAGITMQPIPDNAAEDSYNILPYLLGKTKKDIRDATVHHSIDGNFAIRQGKWKLEFCAGSGGWGAPKNAVAVEQGLPPVQLYDLEADIKEQHNLYKKYPKEVERLTILLRKYIDNGRSTRGKPQKNDSEVELWYNTKDSRKL